MRSWRCGRNVLVIASQRVRPEVAGPMTSSAKQSRGRCTDSGLLRRPCGAPRNDGLALFLPLDPHLGGDRAGVADVLDVIELVAAGELFEVAGQQHVAVE